MAFSVHAVAHTSTIAYIDILIFLFTIYMKLAHHNYPADRNH